MTEQPKQREFAGTDMLPATIPDPKPIAQTTKSSGLEMFDDDSPDMDLPVFTVLESQSKVVKDGVEGAEAGLLWHTDQRKAYKPPVRLMFVHATRGAYKGENQPQGSKNAQCISNDGIEGTSFGECALCEFNWADWTDGPPTCKETWRFVVIMPDGSPAIMRFSSRRLAAARALLKTIKRGVKMQGKALFTHPVVVDVRHKEEGNYSWYEYTLQWDTGYEFEGELLQRADDTSRVLSSAHEQGKLTEREPEAEPEPDAEVDTDTVPF